MRTRVLFAALLLAFAPAGLAAEKKASTPRPKPPLERVPDPGKPASAANPNRRIPYHGKVSAVDANARTFVLKGPAKRVFHLTDKTTITGKDGAPAQLTALSVGDEVTGSATRPSGTWTAASVYIRAPGAVAAGKKKTAVKAAATPAPAATPVSAPAAQAVPVE